MTILPKKLIKYTTKTLRANNNPLFNETFVFDVSTLDLDESQLYLKVRDRYDLPRYVNCESSVFRSTITLGHAIISFVDLQLTAGRNPVRCHRKVIWCLLQPKLKDKITVLCCSSPFINCSILNVRCVNVMLRIDIFQLLTFRSNSTLELMEIINEVLIMSKLFK